MLLLYKNCTITFSCVLNSFYETLLSAVIKELVLRPKMENADCFKNFEELGVHEITPHFVE